MESFAVTDMTAVTTALLFHSESNRKQQQPSNAGCQKCKKKCFVCQIVLLESPSITSVATGASFKIKEALSCKDTWVIYCAICTKCNLQDVG